MRRVKVPLVVDAYMNFALGDDECLTPELVAEKVEALKGVLEMIERLRDAPTMKLRLDMVVIAHGEGRVELH